MYYIRKICYVLSLLLFSGTLHANTLEAGMPLPSTSISERGELLLSKQHIDYAPWHSQSLIGQTTVIQYLPATLSGSKTNMPLINRLYELEHPHSCRTVNIVNIADSAWGTAYIAENELRRHKRRTPLCTIVQDQHGEIKARWDLPEKTTTTLVINEAGVIEFIHSGKLSAQQIEEVIRLSSP